jgi:hypothetical protein
VLLLLDVEVVVLLCDLPVCFHYVDPLSIQPSSRTLFQCTGCSNFGSVPQQQQPEAHSLMCRVVTAICTETCCQCMKTRGTDSKQLRTPWTHKTFMSVQQLLLCCQQACCATVGNAKKVLRCSQTGQCENADHQELLSGFTPQCLPQALG